MAEDLERQVIGLVAADRLYIPTSSFDGKLERVRPKMGKVIAAYEGFRKKFDGTRAYARVVDENKQKARGLRAGVDKFTEEFPQYGAILNGMIEEKRVKSEKHLYFGMQEGRRLTQDDYIGVLTDMGLSPQKAADYYPIAMEISRNLTRKRDETERSVLIG